MEQDLQKYFTLSIRNYQFKILFDHLWTGMPALYLFAMQSSF